MSKPGLNRAELSLCGVLARERTTTDTESEAPELLAGVEAVVRRRLRAVDFEDALAGGLECGPPEAPERSVAEQIVRRLDEQRCGFDELERRGLIDPRNIPFDWILRAARRGRPVIDRLGAFQLGRLVQEADSRRVGVEALVGPSCGSSFDAGLSAGSIEGLQRIRLAEILASHTDRQQSPEKTPEESGSSVSRRQLFDVGACTMAGAAAGQFKERYRALVLTTDPPRDDWLKRHFRMATLSSRRGLGASFGASLALFVSAVSESFGEESADEKSEHVGTDAERQEDEND